MKDLPQDLWHKSYRRRANRRVMDGTPTEKRGGAPAGLRRLVGNHPSKAITSGAISEFVHPYENRYLTIRECARIQTFPDDFLFTGSASDMILQIGNAVPPILAESIAKSVLFDLHYNHSLTNVKQGALLSFVPTVSKGLSPALKDVCKLIENQFSTNHLNNPEQLELWR